MVNENPYISDKERNAKIVVIGDRRSIVRHLFRAVSRLCHTVDIIDYKAVFQEKVRLIKADIVFLDASGQDNLDKLRIFRKIKEYPETKNIKFVIFGSHMDKETSDKYLKLGADDIIMESLEDIKFLTKSCKRLITKKIQDTEGEINVELLLLFNEALKSKKELQQGMDCMDDMIILTDLKDNILRCNRILTTLTCKDYPELLNKKLGEVLNEENGFRYETNEDGYEDFHKELVHKSGEAFHFNINPIKDADNVVYGNIIYCHNVTRLKRMRKEVQKNREEIEKKGLELEEAYARLKEAQSHLLHQEKMASIGQLAAGVAHEINNPIGFIMSNLNTLEKYINKTSDFVKEQSRAIEDLSCVAGKEAGIVLNRVQTKRQSLKLDYILEDTGNLIKESLAGTYRIKDIVQNLKSFSRLDEQAYKLSDINSGMDNTINIIWNELKYKAALKKEYGDIPLTRCNPGELNQVFMNVLLNAVQAIEAHGDITIRTWKDGGHIYISISDTGLGIPEEIRNRIFEPFFTTKDVGKGTGLGLSIAYDIINKHKGEIKVDSEVGKGTVFTIKIPIVS